jgi:hypothetical protein
VASPILKKRLIDAAKALELAVEAMGPNPVNPAFSLKPPCKDPVMPEILRIIGSNPAFGESPPCRITISPKLLKVIGTNPAFGHLPPCRPRHWVQELQITLLETAVWLRHLATAPIEPPGPAPRKRPKARPRPKRARRRIGK